MAFLPAIAAVASIAAGAVSAVGAYQQNKAAAQSSEYNAKVSDMAADAERDAAAAAGEDRRRQLMGQRASSIAARGASGVQLAGTPLMVDEDMFAAIELDVARIGAQGATKATQYKNQSTLDKMTARNYNRAAPVSAGASLLGGISKANYASGPY